MMSGEEERRCSECMKVERMRERGEKESERERERERKATFFNHLTYLIAMNNKCVGLQLGGGHGAIEVCVCMYVRWRW